jgi:hypothetical protein
VYQRHWQRKSLLSLGQIASTVAKQKIFICFRKDGNGGSFFKVFFMEDQNILSATQLNIVILNECRVSVQQKNQEKMLFC